MKIARSMFLTYSQWTSVLNSSTTTEIVHANPFKKQKFLHFLRAKAATVCLSVRHTGESVKSGAS